jgi:anti-sigma factor RsiW
MAECLDVTTLTAFAEGKLAAEAALAAEAHLQSCRRCAEALAKLPVDDELVERLRALEHTRAEAASALSGLNEVVERVSTTVFGAKFSG